MLSCFEATAATRDVDGVMASKTPDANVVVVARVRPQNKIEDRRGGAPCVTVENAEEAQRVHVAARSGAKQSFDFDHTFGPESIQSDVFDRVGAPLIGSILEGFNGTIFAYGQTSSGKTFTMQGPEGGKLDDPGMYGIIPRAFQAIFDGIYEMPEDTECTIKMSYVEIYMERIRDLLDTDKINLQVRESREHGVFIDGATERYVQSPAELLEYMAEGAANRMTAATGMNAGSSRSHSIFILTVGQKDTKLESTKSGTLYLVDLAGSEALRKTGAKGTQLEEAKTINKSLSALGMVINALTNPAASHVPYRDSKLTRVLQESLGGNAKTVLIICTSPSSYNEDETLSTLRFGTRAKRVTNKAKVNEQRSVAELELIIKQCEKAIDIQQQAIDNLTAALESGGGGDTVKLTSALRAAKAKIEELEESTANLGAEMSGKGDEIASLEAALREKEQLLSEQQRTIEARAVSDPMGGAAGESLRASMLQLAEATDDAALCGDLRSAESLEELNGRVDEFRFKLQNMAVGLNTLEGKNEALVSEIETLQRRPPAPVSTASASAPASASASASTSTSSPAAAGGPPLPAATGGAQLLAVVAGPAFDAAEVDALSDKSELRSRLKEALTSRQRVEHNVALLQAAVRVVCVSCVVLGRSAVCVCVCISPSHPFPSPSFLPSLSPTERQLKGGPREGNPTRFGVGAA